MASELRRRSKYGRLTVHRSSQRGGAVIAFSRASIRLDFSLTARMRTKVFGSPTMLISSLRLRGSMSSEVISRASNLVLHILDVGASPETVMQELKFKISSHVNSPPITIPVPVTAHH